MNSLGPCKIKIAGILFFAATVLTSPAQTVTVVHSFTDADGAYPQVTPLFQATDGNLYGTTEAGGTNGDGTVFSFNTDGTLATVVNFDGTSGANPFSGVVQSSSGALYGTTNSGGANQLGTFYRVTGHAVAALVSFSSAESTPPQGGVIQGTDGNFYGTLLTDGVTGGGAVYKVTPNGTLTILYNFTGGEDGSEPYDTLVQGSDGNFYGTTFSGGSRQEGTVFKITPSGMLTTLHSFCGSDPKNCRDGYNPVGGLIQGSDGNFYGMTARGGDPTCILNFYLGCGVIYRMAPNGAFDVLHDFEGADGAGPVGALIQGTDGNFYGTAQYDGSGVGPCSAGCGTLFSMTPSGTFTTLYDFCSVSGCVDGATPISGPSQDTNGTFYGTTYEGGANNYGTIYSLSMGLGPFVKTNPAAALVGKPVKILGTNLTGSTAVTFNGIAATFTVVSATEISTTVPTGATSGSVQVTTPSGTLTSNVVFQVK
jgi:uncharacterized repeat protein (TIGR03803 family)